MNQNLGITTTKSTSAGTVSNSQIIIKISNGAQILSATTSLKWKISTVQSTLFSANVEINFASVVRTKIINHQVALRYWLGLKRKTAMLKVWFGSKQIQRSAQNVERASKRIRVAKACSALLANINSVGFALEKTTGIIWPAINTKAKGKRTKSWLP